VLVDTSNQHGQRHATSHRILRRSVLRLPFYAGLQDGEVDCITDAVRRNFGG
jgi:hypothetical protein